MTQRSTSADCVLMELPLPPGEPLVLVHDRDDMLTIQRGGNILPGCFWRESEMEKAVWEFREIGRNLKIKPDGN